MKNFDYKTLVYIILLSFLPRTDVGVWAQVFYNNLTHDLRTGTATTRTTCPSNLNDSDLKTVLVNVSGVGSLNNLGTNELVEIKLRFDTPSSIN